MLLKQLPTPIRQTLARHRHHGVTLRVLVLLCTAIIALSLFTLPALDTARLTPALLCLLLVALSVWWPAGRTAGWLMVAALACTAAAQSMTASPLIDYLFVALVVYALTTLRPLLGVLYALGTYLLWTVLHYRAADDIVGWLQSNLVLALPAAAAITAGVVYRRSLRRLLQNDQLLQQMQQRADSLGAALRDLQLRVAAEERRRLAGLLTDDLQAAFSRAEQQFQAALSQLQLNLERAQAGLDGARSGVTQALERLRQAVATLRGSVEPSRPLPAAREPSPPRTGGRSWLLLWLLPTAVLVAWPLRSLLDSAFTSNHARLIDGMFSPISLLSLIVAGGLVLTPLIVARVQLRRARQTELRLSALATEIERRTEASRALALSSERTRLARELHDELGSQLVLMNLHLQLAAELAAEDNSAALQQLERSRSVLQGAWQSLLQLIDADLTLQADTLSGALDSLIGAARTNHQATISRIGAAVPPDLSSAAAVCIYRTVQEGLTNALKYAAGAPITIDLQHTPDSLTLQLINGPARSAETIGGGGFGLIGLRERAVALGGSLESTAIADGGWCLTLHLPRGAAAL